MQWIFLVSDFPPQAVHCVFEVLLFVWLSKPYHHQFSLLNTALSNWIKYCEILRIPCVFPNTFFLHDTDSLSFAYILGCILDFLKTFFISPLFPFYYIILVYFFIIYPVIKSADAPPDDSSFSSNVP